MKSRIFLVLTVAAATSFASHAESLTNLKDNYAKELKNQSKITAQNEKWQSRKALNEEKNRELLAQKIWLENRIEQYEKYINTLNSNIAELKRKKLEIVRVSEELEPFLDETSERLSLFINKDIPFLGEERSNRVNFLKNSLADYKISAGEKLRRVLEALQIEAEYGKSIETSVGDIELNGSMVTVDLVRFGRLGYYYITPDRKSFGYYSDRDKAWKTLGDEHKSEIIKALEIADRKRVMDVIYLPVSAKEVNHAE